MTQSFLRAICPSLVLAALLGYAGCSTGTNTGNGATEGPSNTGGAPGTGGASGFCAWEPCGYPVNVTSSDGTTYRGMISADVTIASNSAAQSVPKPPVAELAFSGGEVDDSDAGCQDTGIRFGVDIYISAADSSMDAAGALHVHNTGRNDIYASGPGNIYEPPNPGWAVDLTVTADGQLTGTLSVASSSSSDAGADMQELKFSGPTTGCVPGPDGGVIPASIPVSNGGTFTFKCSAPTGCRGF